MTFDSDREAYSYASQNGLVIDHGEITEAGFDVTFRGDRESRMEAVKEYEDSKPYWGIYTVISNGREMYKRDVDAVAKRAGTPKKNIRDTTFNRYEALLMGKKQAENKAYYLTRNGHCHWKVKRLKY